MTTGTILDRIVADKRDELSETKKAMPLTALEERIGRREKPLDFAGAIQGDRVRLIAEVKKASPSKGLIRADFHPVELTRAYAANGAAAISVLTESRHFQGSIDYLSAIKDALPAGPPLLRKDFIFDPYQVYEARAFGADALLLIVAILEQEQLCGLLDLAHRLGMTALVETHDEEELSRAVEAGARVIGVNNRDLRNFVTDLATTERLAKSPLAQGRIIVSESGISRLADVDRLAACGVSAILVGEALMTAPDLPAKVRELACLP